MQAPVRPKILLLDDDQDLLELYRDMLGRLPSQPEVYTVSSGARALSLLSSEPFSLMLCDLKMPKMDGLQVLSIVRRRFPQLRTAVLTCLLDEQFRTRAYAMGIDLFLEKPTSPKEIQFLLDCIESLLDRESHGGFRGVQSKSLVDILQLECLSQSSSVLKITNGSLEGKIWIHQGEITDAATEELGGVDAFHRVLSWKTGSFELLPEEPNRPRTIFTSCQGLLLETAQALDEKLATPATDSMPRAVDPGTDSRLGLRDLPRLHGVEFFIEVSSGDGTQFEAWGAENPERLATWTQHALAGFRGIGETLQAGLLKELEVLGPIQNLTATSRGDKDLAIGFHRAVSPAAMREATQRIVHQWAS